MFLRFLARQLLRQAILDLPPQVQAELSQRRRHPCVQALFHLKMESVLSKERPVAWRVRRAWHELQRRRFSALCSARRECGLPSDFVPIAERDE